jgi:6-phosphogluconate dehydrogenase (decarboxylating)
MATARPTQLGMVGLGRMGANLARIGGRVVAGRPDRRRVRALPGPGRVRRGVSDSGEGRWTVLASVDEGVPATVITTSLYERFESRRAGEFTDKILSAMRGEFGGHPERAW